MRFTRAAPIVASLVIHVGLVGIAAVGVPRATARVRDVIHVDLVQVEPPPHIVEAPPAPAPPPKKRIVAPTPIVTAPPKPLPARESPAPQREPDPEPMAVALPAVTSPTITRSERATSTPVAAGVSVIETPSPLRAPSSTAVASVAPGTDITRVARPTGGYQIRPSYPTVPRRLGIEGTTMLRVHVLQDGRVAEVNVEQSAGHPDLDQAAVDAVRRWRFESARRGDEKVAMWVRIPVEFTLR